MNDLDRQLIALLRENARMPVVALAKKLRVARATVQNRIARLEQEGVIVGYTLRLKPEEEVHQIRAIMSLAVESNREEAVMRQLRGHVSVVTLHSVNGRWDLVAELRLDTLEAFDRLISTIRAIPGVQATETSIVLATYKMLVQGPGRSERAAGLLQEGLFLGAGGAAQCGVAVRVTAEAVDDPLVGVGKADVACQPAGLEETDGFHLHARRFAVHVGHVEEGPLRGFERQVGSQVDGFLGQDQRHAVLGEGARVVSVQVARELVQHDDFSQPARRGGAP